MGEAPTNMSSSELRLLAISWVGDWWINNKKAPFGVFLCAYQSSDNSIIRYASLISSISALVVPRGVEPRLAE